MANTWSDGRSISRRSLCYARLYYTEAKLYRPSGENKIWLPYNHGGRKEMIIIPNKITNFNIIVYFLNLKMDF